MSSSTGPSRRALATRLTAWYATAVAALLAAAVGVLHATLDADAERMLDESVDGVADRLHANREAVARLAPDPTGDPLRVIDPAGRVWYESASATREFPADRFPPPGCRVNANTCEGRTYTLFTRRVDGWTYQFAANRSQDDGFVRLVYARLLAVGVPALGLFAAGGYLVGRAGLRPLRALAGEMRAVSAERPDGRVRTDGLPRELAAVGDAFNEVAGRLAAAVARLDEFAADVAHELRTPVHNLRSAAELALAGGRSPADYRDALAEVVDEADRLSRLIDRLLLLARLADPRAGLAREPVDFGAELEGVREFFAPAAEEAGVTLEVVGSPGLVCRVDRSLFGRAVANLVANAVAHTPSGGRVRVTASATPDAVVVEVSDTGCGIPADALPRLFDRFYRAADRPTGGLGLGLAIVRRVIELHGGAVAVESREGHGTTVLLTLPRAGEHDTDVRFVPRG